MARIPAEEIERLKSEVSIERLVQARGVVLRKRGEELIGLCPFHEDRSPSLVVNPAKNLWHCLGACQAGGSVIDWVMKDKGISFRHAVEILRTEVSPLAAKPAAPGPHSDMAPRSGLNRVVEQTGDDQQCLCQVLHFYTQTLKQSPEALAYLEKRGIHSSEAIERFGLGYANRTLGYHIPSKSSAEGAALRGRLQEIGIYRASGHEHFTGSLIIPVADENGIVHEVYGRKIGERFRNGTPLHLYLPGPHRGVWNVTALQASEEIILCESLIDALTFWCAGFRNVTASYGIKGFTDEHLDAFLSHNIKRVLIAYDRDEAGDKAAATLAEKLMAEGMECFRIQFPHGMDANEYAVSVKPAEKSLDLVVRKAAWLGKGRGPKDTKTADATGSVGKATKEGNRIDSKGRAAVNLPPIPKSAESRPSSVGAVREPPGDEPSETTRVVFTGDSRIAPTTMASPLPAPTPSQINTDIKPNEVRIKLGDRQWRIRGLEKAMSFDALRVNVLCAQGDAFHVDTFDLYSARHRQAYLKQASEELCINEDVLKKDLGKVLLKLESLQEQQINQALKPSKDEAVEMSDQDKAAALALLKAPDLMKQILSDFETCGVVGEETNKLIGYLAGVSRKLEEPLAVVIQSSSAAGKSSLMEAVLSFFPHEERVQYSAMTGQSLFYMGEVDLQHKILAIAEEAGAEKATYALKLLQSEGELTIASTGKDPATGRLVTQEYRVEGPVMIFLTTTAIEIDDELQNRCIVLTVDEDREQTRAIHRLQRERQTLEGLLMRQESGEIKQRHQNAQRLLRPLLVANPYAEQLTFLDDRTRTRRDHMKYLTLIRSIALLHQYQRPVKRIVHQGKAVSYIEVTLEDIETANRLAHQALGRSLDELAPQTRRLLNQLDEMVTEQCSTLEIDRSDYLFTRRNIRETIGWSYDQVRVHLDRLVDLEYVLVHKGGRGQSFVYELLYAGEGQDGGPFLMSLIDVSIIKNLRNDSTTKSLGGAGQGVWGVFGPPFGPYWGAIGGW
ncbi:MAG: CHC2 zinc finger domain-containing protein [Myxococcota bacterium]|nr:CHC2 zinc finger domain-containing protein [Myxococcota bacterium]